MVGFGDLRGCFQPKQFHDSVFMVPGHDLELHVDTSLIQLGSYVAQFSAWWASSEGRGATLGQESWDSWTWEQEEQLHRPRETL